MWHLLEGDCASWLAASAHQATPHQFQVLYRFFPAVVAAPGSQTFSLRVLPALQPVDIPHIGSQMDQTFVVELRPAQIDHPMALAAFVNGGGPMVTCADLPAASLVLPLAGYGPATSDALLGPLSLLPALGVALFIIGFVLFPRQKRP